MLEDNEVNYTVNVDEQVKQNALHDFNEEIRFRTTAGMGSFDLRYIYFSINDLEYLKVAQEIERRFL